MKLQALLIRLEAWLQAELAAQHRLLPLVEAQEQAIRGADDAALARASEALERELAGEPARSRARGELFDGLAAAWGVASRSLTFGSIVQRAEEAGLDPARLQARRLELKDAVVRVAERGRRVATLARHHQSMLGELLGTLLAGGTGAGYEGARLVDARG